MATAIYKKLTDHLAGHITINTVSYRSLVLTFYPSNSGSVGSAFANEDAQHDLASKK
jgi:hypothetical protein